METAKFLLMTYGLMAIIMGGFIGSADQLPRSFLVFRDIGRAAQPDELVEIPPNHGIGQSFLCNFPNLSGIGFFVSSATGKPYGTLRFHLKESSWAAHGLFSATILSGELKPQNKPYELPLKQDLKRGFFYYVEWPPLADSQGKHYYFYLETAQNSDLKGQGSETVKVGKSKGNLAFITCCAWTGTLTEVGRYFWDKLNQDRPFWVGYGLLLLVTLAAIAANLPWRHKKGARGKGQEQT